MGHKTGVLTKCGEGETYGCGSNICAQNGILVSEKMDQNLRVRWWCNFDPYPNIKQPQLIKTQENHHLNPKRKIVGYYWLLHVTESCRFERIEYGYPIFFGSLF